jgi:hypothetical protein
MGAFEDAADTLWTDENLSKAAQYRLGGAGPSIDVRVLFGQPVRDMAFGNTGLAASDFAARVRLSEVASPKRGDTVAISDVIYKVETALKDSVGVSSLLTLVKG